MNHRIKFTTALALLAILTLQSALPIFACGPGYVSPVFDYKHAPENPFENFAAGKIGIVKPTYRRIVLIAAYRYLNGGGFNSNEQKGLVEVWNAEFNNQPYDSDEDVNAVVKKWVDARKQVVKDEEKTPSIYTERQYGGYEFFPNCTTSAFETATQTLEDRIGSYGAEDKYVQMWVKAQDEVFQNCASGQSIPAQTDLDAPEWLKKDRDYQIAAANFYSLNYETARTIWTRVAEDSDSVWAETADYLIARTLVREASLAKDEAKADEIYRKAEEHLSRLTARGGKFFAAALKLSNLIKYRLHPEARVRELAQTIPNQGASENFRQDLIDYSWLLDKFEKQILEAEDKRREELKKQSEQGNANANANSSNATTGVSIPNDTNSSLSATNTTSNEYNYEKIESGESLSFYLVVGDNGENKNFVYPTAKTDEEIFQDVEGSIGRKLTDKEKEAIQEARRESYRKKTTNRTYEDYQGGYYGGEKTSLALLPDFLRGDDLTDWLFAYQINNVEAYDYALTRWRQNKSDLWLMTALTKAEKNSSELKRLLEEAERVDRNALAFPTIAYHTARLYIAQGKSAEARRLLDDILNSTLDLPISSRNLFLEQRMTLAETLDDFLKFAQRKPFAFDFDGSTGTIEEFIAEQKKWYDPKYYTDQTREEYERQVEANFKDEAEWQNRLMFDEDAVEIITQHFSLAVLIEAQKSPALPEYLQKRLATAIWVRAVLFDNEAAARKITPDFLRLAPEFAAQFAPYQAAATPLERKRSALFLILQNPVLTPQIESGIGKSDNEPGAFDADDWWCAPYEEEYDETTGEPAQRRQSPRPAFLNQSQTAAAQSERAKLKAIGDAPKFFAEYVLQWQKLAPADKRIPEALYITFKANGWTKYGCGNNEELREKIGGLLKTRYPKSKWTAKMIAEETQDQ